VTDASQGGRRATEDNYIEQGWTLRGCRKFICLTWYYSWALAIPQFKSRLILPQTTTYVTVHMQAKYTDRVIHLVYSDFRKSIPTNFGNTGSEYELCDMNCSYLQTDLQTKADSTDVSSSWSYIDYV